MRSVMNRAASWSEEVSLLMMIWFGYLGMALGVREDVHISIEFLFDRIPRGLQIVVEAAGRISIGVFSFAMLREGLRLMSISTVAADAGHQAAAQFTLHCSDFVGIPYARLHSGSRGKDGP